MARNYLEGDEVKLTKVGLCTVDMDVFGGETFRELTPKRLFPMTGADKYISMLDENGEEVAIIRDINGLMPESKKVIEEALEEYYFIPKIKRIVNCEDRFGVVRFEVDTDKGRVGFAIKNRHYDIKKIHGNRILMRDRNDNRYEIEDYTKLDKRSIRMLYQYI